MSFRNRFYARTEYESFEVSPDPLKPLSKSALARMEAVTKLDRFFALVVTIVPALGVVMAIILLAQGYGGPVEFALTAIMYIATLAGMVVGFHRLLAHRAFKTTPFMRNLLAALGSMTFQGPVIWWVATHRRHHQMSDQQGDPHSPHSAGAGTHGKLRTLFHAHIGWLFDPLCMRAPGWGRYAQDLYRDAAIFNIHLTYFYWLLLGFALPALIDGLLTWSWTGVGLGFLWGGLVRIFLSSHFSWAVNSICHFYGRRPFDTPHDHSKNNIWIAVPILGEGWHNNHHAFPSSAMTGLQWWQFDPGGWIIRGLEILGLAWDVKVPTARMIEAKTNV